VGTQPPRTDRLGLTSAVLAQSGWTAIASIEIRASRIGKPQTTGADHGRPWLKNPPLTAQTPAPENLARV